MDPVSAVGLAAATAQFIGIAIKATALCLQIRDSADSATSFNHELEISMLEVKDSRKQLSSTLARKAPRRITDLATKCEQMTNELMKLLEHVRGAGENITTARKVFRALKERKTVEKIQNSLKEKETLLQSLLVQDIWRRFDLQHAEQSKQFAMVDSRSQDIIKELAKLYSNANDNTKGLVQNITSLATQVNAKLDKSNIEAQTRSEQTVLSVAKLSEKVERGARQFSEKSQQRRRYDALLKTLFFSEMKERRANIKDAAPGTLEWVFAPLKPLGFASDNVDASATHVTWDDFGEWLCNHSSVYWICGKLGSGKSTLMAHIVDDSRTLDGLEVWSRGHQIHTFSFFFWRPGTPLQKSTIGLLRSLLYELLLVKPDIVPRLMTVFLVHTERIPVWTEKNLITAVVKVIEIASDTRFCIFIDGMDEFLGDYDELIDLIFKLQYLKNIKFCVSSRPEVHLTRRLAMCEQLHLEDLNYPDIAQYVEQKLSNSTINDSVLSSFIQSEIVHRAEGVFLWATLVTQDVLQGAISGDEEDVLLQRIKRTPRAIDDLFGLMLGEIDELHKASLAFYMKVADTWDDHLLTYPLDDSPYHELHSDAVDYITSVSIVTSSRIPAPVSFGDTFKQSCQQTQVQIGARSAGLLEVGRNSARSHALFWESGSNWFIPSEPNWSHSIQGDFPAPARNLTVDPVPYPSALEHECRGLTWAHRSAYDFFHDSHTIHKFSLPQPSTVDVLSRLVEGGLKYLAIAPSYQIPESKWSEIRLRSHLHPEPSTLTSQRLKYQLICLDLLWKQDSSIALVATDQLLDIIRQFNPRELADLNHEKLVLPADYVFWKTCGAVFYWGYVRQRIHDVPPELYTTLLAHAFIPNINGPEYGLALGLLDLLHKNSSSRKRITPSLRGSMVFICRKTAILTVGVSYSCVRCEQYGFTQPDLAMAMEAFAVAFTRFWSYSCCPREPPTVNKILLRKILSSMSEVSTSADLYIGIASYGRVSLQLSACLFEEYAAGGLPGGGTTDASGLRIVCLPWYHGRPGKGLDNFSDDTQRLKAFELVEVGRFIILVPSPKTTAIILQTLSFEYDNLGVRWKPHLSTTQKALEQCYQMIIGDVWANEQRMSSTDQLFTLACIRLHLRRLFESIWRDVENPTTNHGLKIHSFLKEGSDDEETPEWVPDGDDITDSDWTTDQGESTDAD